jgi:fermentation-respiration switch protein FrsA (DUF1100 family)
MRSVLLIHGTADELVPIAHLQLLSQAAPHAEVWMVEGATHVEGYAKAPQAYLDRIASFFQAALKGA